MALQALTQRIHHHIPLAKHTAFELQTWQEHRLQLTAPLAVNSNDKGSFFAGSQVALCTLGGWALTTLMAEQVAGRTVDVVAVNSNMHYQIPLLTAAQVEVQGVNGDLFCRRIQRRGRAKLQVEVKVYNQAGEITTVFSAIYYARTPQES